MYSNAIASALLNGGGGGGGGYIAVHMVGLNQN